MLTTRVARVLVCFSFCVSVSNSFAVDQMAGGKSASIDKFLSMSLEELLSVKVVSKQNESVIASPGVVSTYYREQLQNLGLHNLREFLHFVPGIEVNETLTGTTLIQIRGLPNKTNQKVLFLLDDVPYWMPASGDFPTLGLPLEGIEKIEIIRGPGSVVYGTNASAGIIKVVTRQDKRSSVNAYANQDGLFNLSYFKGHQISKEKYINIAAEIQRDDGYDYEVNNAAVVAPVPPYPNTDNGFLTRKEELDALITNWKWDNISGTAQILSSDRTGSATGSLLTPSIYETEGALVSVNYNLPLESGALDFYLDYNRYYRQVEADDLLVFFSLPGDGSIKFDNDGNDNDRIRAGVTFKYDVSNNFSLFSGAEYEDRSTENQKYRDDAGGANLILLPIPFVLQSDGSILVIQKAQVYEKSAFVQADYKKNKWRVVSGVRYVNNSQSGSNVSPRVSAVYSLSQHKSIKLLYSQGFNSPTFGQNLETNIFGDPQTIKVSAETIRTWDLAYTHTSERVHHVANLFYTEAHDLILRDTSGTSNNDIIRRGGVEYDFQYINNGTVFMLGVTYLAQGNEDSSSDPDALFASKWLAKFGANYQMQNHVFGGSLRYASSRANVDEYYWLNIHYRNNLTPQLSLYSTLHNVLDDEIFTPDIKNYSTLKYQSANERALYVGIHYSFD